MFHPPPPRRPLRPLLQRQQPPSHPPPSECLPAQFPAPGIHSCHVILHTRTRLCFVHTHTPVRRRARRPGSSLPHSSPPLLHRHAPTVRDPACGPRGGAFLRTSLRSLLRHWFDERGSFSFLSFFLSGKFCLLLAARRTAAAPHQEGGGGGEEFNHPSTSPSPFPARADREGGVVTVTSRDIITQHI